jgi:DNA-binding HxlR family transcriptional regulator
MSVTFAQITTTEITKLATSRVSRSAILVYVAISSHLRDLEGTSKAFPSTRRILSLLGGAVSRSCLFRALKELEAAKLIKRERTKARRSNTYDLTLRKTIGNWLRTLKDWNPRRKKTRVSKTTPASYGAKNDTHKIPSGKEFFIKAPEIEEKLKISIQNNEPINAEFAVRYLSSETWNWIQNRYPQVYSQLLGF